MAHGMVYALYSGEDEVIPAGLIAAVTANSPHQITESRAWS
jgi:hypothetical protein